MMEVSVLNACERRMLFVLGTPIKSKSCVSAQLTNTRAINDSLGAKFGMSGLIYRLRNTFASRFVTRNTRAIIRHLESVVFINNIEAFSSFRLTLWAVRRITYACKMRFPYQNRYPLLLSLSINCELWKFMWSHPAMIWPFCETAKHGILGWDEEKLQNIHEWQSMKSSTEYRNRMQILSANVSTSQTN